MKMILSLCASLLMACAAQAQGMKDPSSWKMNIGPAEPDKTSHPNLKPYAIYFEVTLQKGWHVYALNPGGDGTLIPPSFVFADSTVPSQPFTEDGEIREMTMEGIDGKVRLHEDRAGFMTVVYAKPKSVLKGTYTYQLCNDMMCLPPKTKPFVFRIP